MRASYRLPKAMGRMARVSSSLPPEPSLPPLGGSTFLIPEVNGLSNWTTNYTVVKGHVFIRMVFRCELTPDPVITCTIGGMPMQEIAKSDRVFDAECRAKIFFADSVPIGEQPIVITSDVEAGVAIVRVGELREVGQNPIGVYSGYNRSSHSSGVSIGLDNGTIGNEWAGVYGYSCNINLQARPVSLSVSAPDYYHPESWFVYEVDSSDGKWKVVAAFAAGPILTTPYLDTSWRWQQSRNDSSYCGTIVELIGTKP